MFKSRSKVLLISGILGAIYTIYLIVHFLGGTMRAEDGAELIGGAIATALVAPHMILVALGSIFNLLAFFLKKSGFAITSGILYSVSGIAFLLYIFFVIPMIILSFVGVAMIKKIKERDAQ